MTIVTKLISLSHLSRKKYTLLRNLYISWIHGWLRAWIKEAESQIESNLSRDLRSNLCAFLLVALERQLAIPQTVLLQNYTDPSPVLDSPDCPSLTHVDYELFRCLTI